MIRSVAYGSMTAPSTSANIHLMVLQISDTYWSSLYRVAFPSVGSTPGDTTFQSVIEELLRVPVPVLSNDMGPWYLVTGLEARLVSSFGLITRVKLKSEGRKFKLKFFFPEFGFNDFNVGPAGTLGISIPGTGLLPTPSDLLHRPGTESSWTMAVPLQPMGRPTNLASSQPSAAILTQAQTRAAARPLDMVFCMGPFA